MFSKEDEIRGERECLYIKEIGSKHLEFREHLKQFASDTDVLDETPKDCIEKLALQIIIAYYLRSLEASDYSPAHPSFGKYAAVFCHNWRIEPLRIDTDVYGSEWLDALSEKYQAHADERMPPNESYWDCRTE